MGTLFFEFYLWKIISYFKIAAINAMHVPMLITNSKKKKLANYNYFAKKIMGLSLSHIKNTFSHNFVCELGTIYTRIKKE